MVIETLTSNNLLSFNNWVSGLDGHLSPVFIASFNHPTHGVLECYCKPYNETGKGLFNEIVGFLTIYDHKLPQPEYAFIAILDKPEIPYISQQAKGNYLWLKNAEQVICFCTSRLDGHSAAIHINKPVLNKLVDEVIEWSNYPASLVNDEIVAHTDRHLNNLIRLHKGAFALIDNGRLINEYSEDWSENQLIEGMLYTNRLYDLLENKLNKRSKIFSKCMEASKNFATINTDIQSEICHWAKLLLSPEECNKYIDFQKYRKGNAQCLMRNRLGLVI